MSKGFLLALVLISLFLVLSIPFAFAASCEVADCSNPEDCQQKIEECQAVIGTYSPAHDTNKKQLAVLQKQLKNTESLIRAAEAQLEAIGQEIFDREVDLAFQREVFASKVRHFYIRRQQFSPFLLFLASDNAAQLTRELSYRINAANEDKKLIIKLAQALKQLEADKAKLEANNAWLAKSKKILSQQTDFLAGEVAKVEDYLNVLSSRVASLTAKQQAILAEKSGTFQTTVGDVPLADDPRSRPDFNPGFSPAFAAFSFGAPHFKGMSQYGALGRAKAGQNYETILRAYYGGGIEIRTVDVNTPITVTGYGTYSLEEYVKRIYEMPSSWGGEGGMEALKAQAIAARSYALARGGPICATEACQVFRPAPKGGHWETAVNETAGKVVWANGSPFSTWYASTSGGYQQSYTTNGYTTPGFWDTPSGREGWTSQAWEKQAASPWFYKGWYKTRSGDSCGRSHPWLTSEEMADILNAWAVLFNGAGGDSARVTPLGACWGGNPYSLAELRAIGGFESVSEVKVTYANNGVTAKVTFQTNKGSQTINGADFKKAFNLRAPGRIALKSGLFNIEKK